MTNEQVKLLVILRSCDFLALLSDMLNPYVLKQHGMSCYNMYSPALVLYFSDI